MKLTIVGCHGAYPEKNSATSGYLIEHKDTKVLLDCGSAALSQVQNYIQLSELDAVVISHFHRDHCADLECLQYSVMIDTLNNKRDTPLEIWGAGDSKQIEKLTYKKFCIGKKYEATKEFIIKNLTFSVSLNKHDIASYAIKVKDANGKTLVYSGDTGYYPGFIDFCKNVDCLLCECSLFNNEMGKMKGHLASREVAEIASASKVKSVILTHLPHYGDTNLMVEETKQIYKGDVKLAYKGLNIEI